MKKPPQPPNEARRQQVLDGLSLVYSPAESRFDRITKLAKDIFKVPIALVSIVSREKQWFKSSQGLTASETPREISFCGHAILHDEPLVITNALKNPDFSDNPLVADNPYIRFYAGQPIKIEGENIGTLCIIDRVPRNLTSSEVETLQSLAAWVENELKLMTASEAQKQLLLELDEARRESMIDPLTKTWNRKGLDIVWERELALAKRKKLPVFLMMLDVDNFKEINDLYGHIYGDSVLKEVAHCIRSSCRSYDVIGRYGGDEFIVLSADCLPETGIDLANRILYRINSEDIVNIGVRFSRSVSIGATSSLASKDLTVEALIDLADKALYEAKAAGRNCMKFKPLH